MFTVANNHALDMGKDGFKESAKNLTAAGISFYGDGYGLTDAATAIKEIGGLKIGFIGLNDTFYKLDDKIIVAMIKKLKQGVILSATKDLDSSGSPQNDSGGPVDFVIVNIHWGEEYKTISNTRQRTLARIMIDAGADVVIGHHPHVVEEMEVYKNRPIFYSLGNFIFDQYFSTETQQGLAVGLVLYPHQISVSVFPLQGNKSQVSQMGFESGYKYFQSWLAKSRLGEYNFDNFYHLFVKY